MFSHKRHVVPVSAVLLALLIGLLAACGSTTVSGGSNTSPPSVSVPASVSPSAAVPVSGSAGAEPAHSSDSGSLSPRSSSEAAVSFQTLTGLIGLTKSALLAAVAETPVSVDEGGLGFAKTGIRVWFDAETQTKVAQVLIMTDSIDLNGVRLGDCVDRFKAVFGAPVSDSNSDAHFKYGEYYLSVPYDAASGKSVGVYILAEDFRTE